MKKTKQSNVTTRFMKPALAFVAISALFAGAQSAQADSSNVQMFGTVDVGFLSQTKSAGGGGSVNSMASGGIRPSIWGFKGSEDLGNGNKAFFNFEAHIALDTGSLMADGQGNSPLFRRQSNLGVSGNWGSLTLGRQYSPALLAHIGTEPRAFKENFSNLYAWAFNQLPNAAPSQSTNNDIGIFFSNSAKYANSFGPVSVGVLYSLGEQAGSNSANSAFSLGLTYTGPVTVSGSYQDSKDKTTGTTVVKQTGLGLAVPFTDGAVKLSYINTKNNNGLTGVETSDVNAVGVGVDYKWHPANTLTVAYYDNKDKNNSADQTHNWVFSNDYSLSKRTTLYGQIALVDAKAGATIKTAITGASFPAGAKTTFFNVGINHNF